MPTLKLEYYMTTYITNTGFRVRVKGYWNCSLQDMQNNLNFDE